MNLQKLVQEKIEETIAKAIDSSIKNLLSQSGTTTSKPKRGEAEKGFSDNAVRLYNAFKISNSHRKNAQTWKLISEHSKGGTITLKPYRKGFKKGKPEIEENGKTFDMKTAGIVIEVNHIKTDKPYINQLYITRVEYGKKNPKVVTFDSTLTACKEE